MTSCSEKRETESQFGKYALDKLISKSDAYDIYIMPKDSIFTHDTLLISWFKELQKYPVDKENYIKRQNEEINAWRKKAIILNLKKSNVEYLRTVLDTVDSQKDLTIFFLIDKEEYFFKLIDVDSLNTKWVAFKIELPTNKEEQAKLELEKRKKEAKEPYQPWGLDFASCNWEYKNAAPKKFSNFFVTLKNSTSNNFKRVRFKVTIFDNREFPKTEIFSKTIEMNKPVYSGDLIRIEIIELRNFYTGFNIKDEKNFDWNAEVIDAKPKPGFEDLPY
jgi:hypothetical protein